jgi:hypothetical protein
LNTGGAEVRPQQRIAVCRVCAPAIVHRPSCSPGLRQVLGSQSHFQRTQRSVQIGERAAGIPCSGLSAVTDV